MLFGFPLDLTNRPKVKPAVNTAKLCQALTLPCHFADELSWTISSPKDDVIRPQTDKYDPDILDCSLVSIDDRLFIDFRCFALLSGFAKYVSIHRTAALSHIWWNHSHKNLHSLFATHLKQTEELRPNVSTLKLTLAFLQNAKYHADVCRVVHPHEPFEELLWNFHNNLPR